MKKEKAMYPKKAIVAEINSNIILLILDICKYLQ